MDENESNVKIAKTVATALACVALVMITSVTGCYMHDNQMEAVNTAAQGAYLKIETEQDEKRGELLKNLISKGVNPVAARCAILGWESERDAIVCATAGAKNPEIVDKETTE